MDLQARALADLRQLHRDACATAPRTQSRRTLLRAIAQCASGNPIRVVPCAAPRIRRSEYTAILDLLESLDWRPFASKSDKSNASRTSRRAARGSANFVMGITKGAAGSSGFSHSVPTELGSSGKRGGTQGVNYDIVKSKGLSQRRALTKLWRVLKDVLRRIDPTYRFTSVQVNRNFAGQVHRDRSDRMHQYALSLGSFTGGELVVSTDDPGTYVRHDTRGRLTRCDGRHPHWVTAHTGGTRYSVILYNVTARPRLRESNLDTSGSVCRAAHRWDARSYPRSTPEPK